VKVDLEKKVLYIIVPLDPTEGAHHTKLVCDYEEEYDLHQI